MAKKNPGVSYLERLSADVILTDVYDDVMEALRTKPAPHTKYDVLSIQATSAVSTAIFPEPVDSVLIRNLGTATAQVSINGPTPFITLQSGDAILMQLKVHCVSARTLADSDTTTVEVIGTC